MARVNTLFQIFLFPLSRETRSNTFLKNTSTPRHNQLLWAYFLYSHHGMDSHLTKPLTGEVVVKELKRLMHMKKNC